MAVQMANAGIYDLRIHHDDVIMPLLRHWQIFEIDDLDEQGEQARENLASALGSLDARATRVMERRAMAETGD
jgi:acyl-[acyl-carrier-protein] desaturase